MTAFFNRAYLDEFLIDQFVTDSAQGKPTSVLFCSFDGLEAISEKHGSAAAEACLAHLAGNVSQKLRNRDQAVRWEEDRFIVVLPGTDAQTAKKIAKRVQTTATTSPFTVESGETFNITLSIGCATHDRETPSPSLESLIHLADFDLGSPPRQRMRTPPESLE